MKKTTNTKAPATAEGYTCTLRHADHFLISCEWRKDYWICDDAMTDEIGFQLSIFFFFFLQYDDFTFDIPMTA